MSITQSFISEIEREATATKKALERVPVDKFEWSPHEESSSLKKLATHLAQLGGMSERIVKTEKVDEADSPAPPEVNSAEDLVKIFEESTQQSIDALKSIKDEDLQKNWFFHYGDYVISDAPKDESIRAMALSHAYHHRAQLGVYLRLLDVPVPSTYGPSADED